MSTSEAPQTLVGLVEGYYLSQIVRFLHHSGLVDALEVPASVQDLAKSHGLDPELLRLVLRFVAERSDLLEPTPEGYICAERYRSARDGTNWLISQYLGAYEPVAADVGGVLRDPARGPGLVDERLHARAFDTLDRPAYRALPAILRELAPSGLVDLGCGAGGLLRSLARERPEMRGWGLDANPEMCRRARERIAHERLGARLTILEGGVGGLRHHFPADAVQGVDVVVCASLLNQGWSNGDVVAWLTGIRDLFQGRTLVVADYYGRLGWDLPGPPRLALLHDLVQALSGQGVPPPDREGWRRVYEKAGCTLLHAFEAEDPGVWFVHLLRL